MIPLAYIQVWQARAPWSNPAQVEQDLIICRALCDLFNAPALQGKIAFRGDAWRSSAEVIDQLQRKYARLLP